MSDTSWEGGRVGLDALVAGGRSGTPGELDSLEGKQQVAKDREVQSIDLPWESIKAVAIESKCTAVLALSGDLSTECYWEQCET